MARESALFPQTLSVLCCLVSRRPHIWHGSQDLMIDPVVAADGVTYERKAIEDWFGRSGDSPLMGASTAIVC